MNENNTRLNGSFAILIFFVIFVLLTGTMAFAQFPAMDTAAAANAINSLGIDLLANTAKPDGNSLLSPYSIQSGLVLTYAGADGQTRDEMAKVLYFPKDDAVLNGSFAALRKELDGIEQSTAKIVADSKQRGGPSESITLSVANRLFGQQGYDFREPFLNLLKDNYGAPFDSIDFVRAAASATKQINEWVADQTRQRICDLIPHGAINCKTRLVLVNAIYLKAPWESEFEKRATQPKLFHVAGKESVNVPTMFKQGEIGYLKRSGYTAISLPYVGADLQFLILLPNDVNGLSALEKKLNAKMLEDFSKLENQHISLYLPKFKIEPLTMNLGDVLQSLGMKSAFDHPRGSANFDKMAPRKPGDYLYISQVFHKTFLSLNENGTEAAAATAVVMMRALAIMRELKPIEVLVDHPFLFAIQHRQSGACLFLGRVNDPRDTPELREDN